MGLKGDATRGHPGVVRTLCAMEEDSPHGSFVERLRSGMSDEKQMDCYYACGGVLGEANRKAVAESELPASNCSGARLTRVQIENAIIEASQNEPFTMPFFLASCLVAELRRQKLNRVTYTGDDFSVAVRIKKVKPSND